MAEELGLSDAQVTQIKSITRKYMDGSLGDVAESMREARANVRKTIHDVNATDDQVREASAVVAVLESQRAVQHHRMAIEIAAVLTPEQRAQLAERLAGDDDGDPGPRRGGPDGF
jgi:Spy/CpxP family protein refolding chaperone